MNNRLPLSCGLKGVIWNLVSNVKINPKSARLE